MESQNASARRDEAKITIFEKEPNMIPSNEIAV